MSGPSGVNTKASKIERILGRQQVLLTRTARVDLKVNELTERLSNSLKLATETANRLEAENAKLRKYLGSELFARRQREMQIPTLNPHVPKSPQAAMDCHCSVCMSLRARTTLTDLPHTGTTGL